VIGLDIFVVTDRTVGQCRLECCRMAVTIYRRPTKLFPPTWQHHHQMIDSTIVHILQYRMTLSPPVDQYRVHQYGVK
jgi:hypothetical protein